MSSPSYSPSEAGWVVRNRSSASESVIEKIDCPFFRLANFGFSFAASPNCTHGPILLIFAITGRPVSGSLPTNRPLTFPDEIEDNRVRISADIVAELRNYVSEEEIERVLNAGSTKKAVEVLEGILANAKEDLDNAAAELDELIEKREEIRESLSVQEEEVLAENTEEEVVAEIAEEAVAIEEIAEVAEAEEVVEAAEVVETAEIAEVAEVPAVAAVP